MDRPLLVTSALPYANGPLHLGHLAGAYLPADLYVRYQRLIGRDVVYICGSDEHGVAILIRAMKDGVSPKEIIDRYHAELEEAFKKVGISFDYYGRTSSGVHHDTTQALFRKLDENDGFVVRTEKQLYDPEAELFLADRFIQGTCPVCGYEDAFGDQCENCGSSLSPKELGTPTSTLSGAEPVERETTHWYFPLGAWQPRLEEWIGEKDWKANVLGQIKSWFQDGLTDRAMTRDLPWGVEVPESTHGDTTGKVLYVWFDAPIGYISATKEWASEQDDPDLWKRYWQVNPEPAPAEAGGTEPELVHFIGKDNIVFHTLIFPGLLMALNEAGDGPPFVLPANVPANEFLNLEGRKLSTSRGWAVWVNEAAETFEPDLLRYGLATMLPETKDADFSWSEFQARVNGELADVLGNFVNRTLTFAHRFADGVVPALQNPTDADNNVLAALEPTVTATGMAYERVRLREAIQEAMGLARLGNRYFNDSEPWKTRESDPQACANTIHVALQVCATLSIIMEPVVPNAMATLRKILQLNNVRDSGAGDRYVPFRNERSSGNERIGWRDAASPLLVEGQALGEPQILFRKIEDEEVEAQLQLLEKRSKEAGSDNDDARQGEASRSPKLPYTPLSEMIEFDDFEKLDLRLGTITAAEPHPNADKLLRFDVDLGFEVRQILSGVVGHLTPEEMLGKTVVVVANLAPRTIRGLESQGMILFAEDREGNLVPVTSEGEPGAVVR